MAKETKTQLTKEQLEAIKKAKEILNGCPLMNGREKCDWTDIEGNVISIEEYFKIKDYYCVTLKGIEDKYFLTGQALTELIDSVGEDVTILYIEVGEKVKTKNNNTYRTFTVMND